VPEVDSLNGRQVEGGVDARGKGKLKLDDKALLAKKGRPIWEVWGLQKEEGIARKKKKGTEVFRGRSYGLREGAARC